ncbi:phage tail tape measure protein [Plesiomonas shigelloides]|uniref:phage tail tape measure protein n=1 Tax=Plesiomonas shigelloides TaxID=703 RepID=UPI001261E87F|nr:phage tail tape measure protein [Plesiomonas shigelloides]KAB7697004.1 phage tail tape measure protein [Plesiomonas shigelloides]
MSDRNLRLQVVLSAVEKLTRPFKQAQASTRALAADVKNSRDELKRLEQAGQKLTSFNALSRAVKQTGSELEQARLKAQMMTRELSQLDSPTKKQTKALEDQWRAVSKLEAKQRDGVLQMGKTRAELYRMGISAKDGEQATARIASETERYNAKLKEQERMLKRVGERQRKMAEAKAQYSKTLEVRDRIAGAGASSMGAGIAMGMPVFNAVKSYSAMEDAMKGIAKQVNGLLDDNGGRTAKYQEMQKEIQRLSETLPMANGAMDIAALVEGGARMGVANDKDPWDKQKKDLLSFAAVSAKASKAFEMPADQLAEDLGKIAFLYKIPMRNIEDLGDTLNYLDDNAQSKGADIINVMQRMGDIADKMDYKQAAALGSTFLSLGAAPEVAASASKAMVRELGIASMQSQRFSDGMKSLGLNATQLEKGIANNAVATIKDVLGRIKGLSKEKQLSVMTQLFGKEFGDDAQKLGLNIDEFIRQLDLTQKPGAKGSMQRESDIDKNSLSSQYLLLKTGVNNTFSSLGESLRDPLMEIITLAKQATGAFRRFVEENPRLAGVLMKTAAGLSALLVVMGSIAVAVAAVIGPMAVTRFSLSMLGVKTLPSLTSAVTKAGGAFAWLASSPLSFMRRGIASSGNRVGLLSKVFNSLGASVRLVGKALKAIAGGPLTVIRTGMSALSRIVGIVFHPIAALRGGLSLLGRALSFLVSGPMALLRLALYGISGLLAALLSPIGLVVTALAGVALVIWKHWQPISAFLSGVVEGFQSAAAPISAAFEPLKPVFQWIGDKVQALYGWFADLLMPIKYTSAELQSATAMGRQFGESLAAGLNMVMHPLESLKSGISWLLEKLGVVSKEAAKAKLPEEVTRKLPSTVSGNGKVLLPAGSFSSMGFAGMYDSGGYIPSGQFGIVGERGPELVNGPARVTSRKQTAVMAAVAALGMSAAVPAAAAPLHPMSLPAAEYRTSSTVSVKQSAAPVVSAGKTEIHIHAAANQSPQDIARIVMQAMDERDRKLQARARSQFSDREMF